MIDDPLAVPGLVLVEQSLHNFSPSEWRAFARRFIYPSPSSYTSYKRGAYLSDKMYYCTHKEENCQKIIRVRYIELHSNGITGQAEAVESVATAMFLGRNLKIRYRDTIM